MSKKQGQLGQADEISLRELILKVRAGFCYLRSKWLIILISVIVGGALGLAYSLYKKPLYTATLTFALEEKNSGNPLGAYADMASQFGIAVNGTGATGAFSGDNIMELMKSRLMVTKTLLSGVKVDGKEESLADYYIEIKGLRSIWKKKANFRILSFPINRSLDSLSFIQDSVMGGFYNLIVKNNLTVDMANKNSSIIAVKYKSANQLFSKYFTEDLVKNVTAFYISTKTKQTAANITVLQNRLDSVRVKFSEALYGTATAIDQNLDPVRAVAGISRIRSQTNAEILSAEYGELTKNLEVARMSLLQETPLIQVIDKPVLPLEKSKLGKLKGIIIGGIIGAILCLMGLISYSLYKKIMFSNNEDT